MPSLTAGAYQEFVLAKLCQVLGWAYQDNTFAVNIRIRIELTGARQLRRMFRIFILLIYCAASGDIMDNDSEYITNDDNDNNNGSDRQDIVDNEYLANDEYYNTDNTQNTTSGHNPQTSSCVTTGGERTGAHCVFPFRFNVRIASIILLIQ